MWLYNSNWLIDFDELDSKKELSPRELLQHKNKHIPEQVFNILEAKNFEVFSGNIDKNDSHKPILWYIPSKTVISVIHPDLVFLILWKYETIKKTMIYGQLKSVWFLYSRDKENIEIISKQYDTKRHFIISSPIDRTWTLLIRR